MCFEGDMADVFNETRPVARRSHRCGECDRRIEPGEAYLRVGILYERSWTTAKMCAHCDAATDWLRVVCNSYYAGGVGEDLREHFIEHWEPIRSISLGRLVVGMRRDWRGIDVETVRRWAAAGAQLARAAA